MEETESDMLIKEVAIKQVVQQSPSSLHLVLLCTVLGIATVYVYIYVIQSTR